MKKSTPPKTPVAEINEQVQQDDQNWLAIVAGKTPPESADPKTVQEALALRHALLKQAQAQETVSLANLEKIKERLRANGHLPKLPSKPPRSRFYDDWEEWLSWKKLTLVTVYTSLVAVITLRYIPTEESTAPTLFIPKSQSTVTNPIPTQSKVIEITCYRWQKLQKQLLQKGLPLTFNSSTWELVWPEHSFTAEEWKTLVDLLYNYQITPEKYKFQEYAGLRTAGLQIKLLDNCQGEK